MLRFEDSNELLMDAFDEMKKAYDDDDIGYGDTPYSFYSEAFVSYILRQLDEDNDDELNKIFEFIERLFKDGDKYLAGLARISIVDDISYEVEFEKYKGKVFALCGELTREAFEDIEEEADEYRKSQLVA